MMDIRKLLGVSDDQTIRKIKPSHGECCTCQTCGYPHDECWCEDNVKLEACRKYEQLQTRIAELEEQLKELKNAAIVNANGGGISFYNSKGERIE